MFLNRLKFQENIIIPVLAAIAGIATALMVAIYKLILNLLFNITCEASFGLFLAFAPAIGGALTGIWLYIMRAKKTPSVDNISDFVTSIENKFSVKDDIASIVGSIFTIGFGGSLGPEAPSAQIGAATALGTGNFLKLNQEQIKTLVGCGVAAGISAAFSAPIAGFIFAIEVIYKNLPKYALASIMLSSVTAAATIELFYGRSPAFGVPDYTMGQTYELVLYFVLGILAAFVVLIFNACIKLNERIFAKLSVPTWLKPSIGGLAVGIIAILISKDILGTGYSTIQNTLAYGATYFIFAVLVAKIFAISISAASGGQGGLIAPSLFLGSSFGVGVGIILQNFIPSITPSAFGLVGMGAVLAGVARAPMLGVILPFEMTQDYEIILPLTLCVTTTFITLTVAKFR